MSVELPTLTFFKRGVNWVVFGSLKGGVIEGVIFSLIWGVISCYFGSYARPINIVQDTVIGTPRFGEVLSKEQVKFIEGYP
jgi:hypothetical protein